MRAFVVVFVYVCGFGVCICVLYAYCDLPTNTVGDQKGCFSNMFVCQLFLCFVLLNKYSRESMRWEVALATIGVLVLTVQAHVHEATRTCECV